MNRIGNNLICTGSNKDIVQAFKENDVEFLVVGGLAVSWYCRDRQADDMDLLVNCTLENSSKVFNALAALRRTAGIKAGSFAKPGVQAKLGQNYYADIITESKDGPSYIEANEASENANLFNIPVKVPNIQNLIELKLSAIRNQKGGTSKHERDIELLRKLNV